MTHGVIISGEGCNTAQVVLDDLGVEVDWTPPPIASRLAAF